MSDVAAARHEIANLEAVKALESMRNKPAVLTKPAIAAWKKSKGLDKKYLLSEDDAREAEEWNRGRKWVAFNPASNKHKQKLFLDILHMPVVKLTTGTVPQPQMNKAVMKAYGPVGKLFITLQNLTKQLEELEKIELLSRVDGRVHFPMKSGGTVTSRSSSKA